MIKILFKSHDYTNEFDEINANKLFKHKSNDRAIETKNKNFSFDFIYNSLITKF